MTTPAWPSVHSQPLCLLCSLSLNPEASSGRVRQPKGQHTGSEIRRADDQTDDAGRESSQFPATIYCTAQHNIDEMGHGDGCYCTIERYTR